MKVTKKKRKTLIITASVLGAIFILFTVLGVIYIDNRSVDYEYIHMGGGNDTARQLKIAHLSDLHFNNIKADTKAIVQKLLSEQPDLIAVTGDLIDDAKGVGNPALFEMAEAMVAIAPVYYVEGNHEVRSRVGETLNEKLRQLGVTILLNDSTRLSVRGMSIEIIGLRDAAEYRAEYAAFGGADYRLLLAHHPEQFPSYSDSSHAVRPDLVLSGHAHGGQFRIFGQGVLSPGQGFFPKYDSGLYHSADGEVAMVVSRGIGNSLFPFRFNNKPHIPIITVFIP